jgi:hypothetical protein
MGTKSLLIGAHQILWHPFTLLLAWIYLYGWPNWKEMICIFIHDWGYWGLDNMEGPEGQWHPAYAANLADEYLGHEYFNLILLHSRTVADKLGEQPSPLCWADKLCVYYERWWTYLPRVILSGEIHEYYQAALDAKLIEPGTSYIAWFNWARTRMIRKAIDKDARPPYLEGS